MKKKVNQKNRDKLIILGIVVVIIIAIIVCVVVVTGKKDNNEANQQSGQSNTTGNEEQVELDGQIDYSKTDNVEIKDNVKTNNSSALNQEKEFEGMKVKNIKLEASQGTTKFLATVENTSTNDFAAQKIVIVFKNQDGSEYERLETYLGDIKVGKSLEIDASTTSDLSNAYDFIIEKDNNG